MTKDLTTSQLDRQNILNNKIAVAEIQSKSGIEGIFWEGNVYVTRDMVATFFEIDVRTVSRYIEQNAEELKINGYQVLKGKKLKSFIETANNSGKDIYVPTKTTVLGVFDFKSFLNLSMLLVESERARMLRQMILDIVSLLDFMTRGNSVSPLGLHNFESDFNTDIMPEPSPNPDDNLIIKKMKNPDNDKR